MTKKVIVGGILASILAGCSSNNAFGVAVRNLTAANCVTPEAQQAFVNNLPPDPFLNTAQKLQIQASICHAIFGDVAAPTTAPGNQPAIK